VGWSATGSLLTARTEFTTTLLPDGRVLAAGGVSDCCEEQVLASAELYDPTTGEWSATGSMVTPRANHTATLLPNGKVLVAGGDCPGLTDPSCRVVPPGDIDPDAAITLAELYDPATGTWSPTGKMTTARFGHTATLLDDGTVLAVGAEHADDAILPSADIYDPKTGKWSAASAMSVGRTQQFTVKLVDGRVLVAGGMGPSTPATHEELGTAEIFDPKTGRWTATGNMITPRAQGGPAVLLSDGTVLVPGGGGDGDTLLGSAEIYDPARGEWRSTTSMPEPRVGFAAVPLRDGRVFLVGGFTEDGAADPSGVTASNPLLPALMFDPATPGWTDAGSLGTTGRSFALTATLLSDGRVLVAGGFGGPSGPTSTAYLFDPALWPGK
jgi:N-acetylneuraminic acid mutarotase